MDFLLNGSCLVPSTGAVGHTFISAITFFIASQCSIINEKKKISTSTIEDGERFDFIIVGAGSTGSVIANRLSEIKGWKILLLEAGDEPAIESSIPGLDESIYNTKYDWQFRSADNKKSSQGITNGSLILPQGKMFGGTSNLNKMFYLKGSHYDYLNWFNQGNMEWHPDIVKIYFKKAESYQNQNNLEKNPTIGDVYGSHGPLVINQFNSTFKLLNNNILDAWNDIGIKTVYDLNSAGVLGAGVAAVTAKSGMREDTATAYLADLVVKSNVKIIKNTTVTKILINETKQAYGVTVIKNGVSENYFVDKEVIVSAGVINTPKLLMLSGIGPKSHLESLGILTNNDLPAVGQNLQDHLNVPVMVFGENPSSQNEADDALETLKYLKDRTGSLAQGSTSDIISFYSQGESPLYPDFESYFLFYEQNSTKLLNDLTTIYRYKQPIIDSIIKQNENQALYWFSFHLLHPFSKGNITLISGDPKDSPLIYLDFFSDQRDLKTSVQGLMMLSQIVNTKYFKSVNGSLGETKIEPCNKYLLDSIQYWQCVAQNIATSGYNLVGTARMGNDPTTSVVDGNLKVHSIAGLRVADASVMPFTVSSDINSVCIMIGERISDLIKDDYGF